MSLLSLREAAAFLRLHPKTVLVLVNSGQVPASRFGRKWLFVRDDLVQCVRSRYVQQEVQQPSVKTQQLYNKLLGL